MNLFSFKWEKLNDIIFSGFNISSFQIYSFSITFDTLGLHTLCVPYLNGIPTNIAQFKRHVKAPSYLWPLLNATAPQVGALHGVSPGKELRQPGEQQRLSVRRGRLRHGPNGEQGGGSHGGHRRLAVSLLELRVGAVRLRCACCEVWLSSFCSVRYEEDKKQWGGMLREMRYAAGSSCVSMRLNAARMPKL